MADALIRYETIDAAQIEDIMAGRQPRPPAESSDTGPAAGQGSGADSERDKAEVTTGQIGGPASLH
jgi:cell division protease FtsH